ncbi:uncharacterized protein F4812DRAFT_389317 [Daldinia caldariorum]|uniref:uncharacterized protein n=1 Tax=Daldinia caldariorum TaxID=326644 RepID=UPI0020088441|nr:uncharacterized protein F4812DRAFT_389317 [Daldinia caldariorum]KAI1468068.1 hypothetical protein F4812DRAFT_389317 [Daldinia caldariorum]
MSRRQKQKDDTEVKAISNDIMEMYNRGIPLFTKDAIRRVAEQLDKYRDNELEGNKLRFKNMKGEDFEVILDPNMPPVWVDKRCNHGDSRLGPYIYYRSIQYVLAQEDMNTVNPQKACLAIGVTWPGPRPVVHHHRMPSIDETVSTGFHTAKLSEAFDDVRQQWETSEQYAQLKKLLKSKKAQLSNVKKIVAFALGTLATGSRASRPSMVQHALVLSLQQLLRKTKEADNKISRMLRNAKNSLSRSKPFEPPFPCFAQDPAYLPCDKRILAEAGITVLEDPRAFLEVDDTCLVVSVDPNIPVRQIIADIARPVAIIQHRMMEMNGPEAQACADHASVRVQRMLEGEYDEEPLRYHESLHDVSMYIRKPMRKTA